MAEQDPALEGQDNPERPEWLPENFESPEAFAVSYKEAQRKITELGQEKRGLEEAIQSLSTQFEEFTAAQNRPDPNAVYNQWHEQYESDPFNTTLSLAQAVAQQTAQQVLSQQQLGQQNSSVNPDVVAFIADQTMTQAADDWAEYKEKVAEEISQNPLFQRDELWGDPNSAAQALTSAYNMVKARDVLSGNNVVQQQAADTRAMKLAAQSAAGASGRTPAMPDDQAEWERIKAAGNKPYWA